MVVKKYIVLSLSLLCFSACSQQTEKQANTTKMNTETITSQNFVSKVLEHVKHYDKEPTYWLNIYKKAGLEIYVNDMPVFKAFDDRKYSTGASINYMILKSGEQKIKYRIESKEKEVYIGIEVVEIDNKGAMKVADEKMIKNYEKTIQMPANGVYEEEFTFTAEVPYENKGWSDGQDLRKLDKDRLQKAVVAYYQKMWDIYNDKSKKEKQFPLILEREIAISEYSSRKKLETILQELLFPFTDDTYKIQPLENYKMVFYGYGKLVGLEQTSMDIRLRGGSALWAKYKYENSTTIADYTQILLYLPPGKKLEDGLQIIR